ncbi:MAG TPA: CAP domain-containing protein, partial [Flavisolibacter sp.]
SNMKAIMFLPFVFALLVSCTREGIDENAGESTSLPSTVNKTTLLSLVNDVRRKGCQCGDTWYGPAPAIEWNSQLELAAYNHSKDMKEKNYFSHTSPDGSDAGDRISAAGYNWTSYGENIGQGYSNEQMVVNGWLKSPGHCRNIMNKLYREMGVAKVGSYWTQVMASRE